MRRGLLPYLRGGRRAELRTADGRVRLAHSVRLAVEEGGTGWLEALTQALDGNLWIRGTALASPHYTAWRT